MIIVYDSKTNNVQRFVDKINTHNCIDLNKISIKLNKPFILITYTTGFGEVPESTIKFLEGNKYFLKGVISSGNKNWGLNYGKAADLISEKYNVPLIHKFELSGTLKDLELIIQEVNRIDSISKMD